MAGEPIKNFHGESHLYAPWYFVKIPTPLVRLADATGVLYSYMVWVHLRSYSSMFRAREELYREIHRGLQHAGTEVAPHAQELRTHT